MSILTVLAMAFKIDFERACCPWRSRG